MTMYFARHPFILNKMGATRLNQDEPEIVDGELTGEVVAFFPEEYSG